MFSISNLFLHSAQSSVLTESLQSVENKIRTGSVQTYQTQLMLNEKERNWKRSLALEIRQSSI